MLDGKLKPDVLASIIAFPGLGKTTLSKEKRDVFVDSDDWYKSISKTKCWHRNLEGDEETHFLSFYLETLRARRHLFGMPPPVVLSNLMLDSRFCPALVAVPEDVKLYGQRLEKTGRHDLLPREPLFPEWKENFIAWSRRMDIPVVEMKEDEYVGDLFSADMSSWDTSIDVKAAMESVKLKIEEVYRFQDDKRS